jgi:hypothetical protein
VRYSRRVDRLKHYEVLLGLLDVHYIEQPVVVCYLEGEDLLAEFAVEFLEFDDDLPPVDFHRLFGLEPAFETLQVDRADGARAVARRDQRVEVARLVIFFRAPADTAGRLALRGDT